ncbi:hypothetical protein HanPI659440_Chr09g0315751 [Helianthus annuus]|nr:hypothetical protein HanPI659440_Chr09g0315751 [Helianthus annuus]
MLTQGGYFLCERVGVSIKRVGTAKPVKPVWNRPMLPVYVYDGSGLGSGTCPFHGSRSVPGKPVTDPIKNPWVKTGSSTEDSKEEEKKPPWMGLGIDMLVIDNHGKLFGQFSRLLDDDLKIC